MQSIDIDNPYVIHKKFDEKQREAICLDSGYHLVLAPAGCGKTDILAERVSRAIHNGVNIEDMLCLTFTNRASRNMRKRVKDNLKDRANELFIGNTHRFCSKFVFENNLINQTSAILDEEDTYSIILNIERTLNGTDDAIEEIDIAKLDFDQRKRLTAVAQLQHLMVQYRLGHPKSVRLYSESDYISNDKSDGKFFSPEQFALLCKEAGLPISIGSILYIYDNSLKYLLYNELSINSRELYVLFTMAKHFELYKQRESVIDFDDLLILAYEYARKHPNDIKKYSWIQIDEVQDLNPLQFAIVDAFTAEDNVTVYLGDEQQAIFSFIGAKLDTLVWLKERCGENLHHLNKCYRSPKYLLDVFNDYAETELDTDPDFLPSTDKTDISSDDNLIIYRADSSTEALDNIQNIVNSFPDGKTAIIVTSNADADKISEQLGDWMPHFKISGADLFAMKQTKLLIAHLNVINNEINFLAWARILSTLKVVPSYAKARDLVSHLKSIGMNPSDFLTEDSPYLLRFINCYRSNPIVIFDTETTGLNVFEDDIVQIAATKYINGNPIEKLNIFLHTDKEIPEKLGSLVNPLIEEYAHNPHIDRKTGLLSFVDFAKDCILIGHNVQYDYNILLNNCKRDLPNVDIPKMFNWDEVVFDTLKLARLVNPSLRSYKLKDLLSTWSLSGENSHLADADIEATFYVAEYIYHQAIKLKTKIIKALDENSDIAKTFRAVYGNLFNHAKANLYDRVYGVESAIVEEIRRAYKHFCIRKIILPFNKFEYICKFIEKVTVDKETEPSLGEQLSNHIMDINTYKEADLCGTEGIVNEDIFIATVHKAKGLEFENVIVYGCVDGNYPYFADKDDPYAVKESSRKLYVAMTRAKTRLCLITFNWRVVYSMRYKKLYKFKTVLSPFLTKIIRNHPFVLQIPE